MLDLLVSLDALGGVICSCVFGSYLEECSMALKVFHSCLVGV